jgi:hypothetical protein
MHFKYYMTSEEYQLIFPAIGIGHLMVTCGFVPKVILVLAG